MELNIFPHDAIRRCMFVRCQQKFIYTNCFCQFERVTPISCFLPDPSFTDTSSVKHKPYFHFWDTCWTFKCHFSSVWARVSWGQQWMCDHSVQWSLAAVQLLKVKSACAEASQQWDNTPFKTVSWLYLSWTFDLTLKSQTGTYRYRSVLFFFWWDQEPRWRVSSALRIPPLYVSSGPACSSAAVQHGNSEQSNLLLCTLRKFSSLASSQQQTSPDLSSVSGCYDKRWAVDQHRPPGAAKRRHGGTYSRAESLLTLGFNKDSSWDCLCTLKCDWCWLRNCEEFDGGLLPTSMMLKSHISGHIRFGGASTKPWCSTCVLILHYNT